MTLRAKKSLGQHFLRSQSAIDKIVETSVLQENDLVLEIGPGEGVLTRALLEKRVGVIAVEKDSRAIDMLKNKFATYISNNKLSVVEGDILELNKVELGLKDGQYKIVANIPYYITGSILQTFLENIPRPSSMTLLVQEEVADRIVARDKKESILSVSVKVFGEASKISKVPRGSFYPVPKVDSAILFIGDIQDRYFSNNTAQIRAFFDMVHAGFAHKRKLLKNNIETILSKEKIKEIWNKLSLPEKVRAEDLNISDWIKIHSLS